MKKTFKTLIALSLLIIGLSSGIYAQKKEKSVAGSQSEQQQPLSYFNVYRGNTHAHTIFTWTHGSHRSKSIAQLDTPTEFSPDFKAPATTDWKDYKTLSMNPADYTNLQGLPANHYIRAMANGFDFYATTDHSQEPTLQPVSTNNPFWQNIQKTADEYNAKPKFVAIPGFEYSRNTAENGGEGHINVLNSKEYVNADFGQRGPAAPWPGANWNIPQFYNWVKTAKPYDEKGCVVVGFNHPQPDQYNDWDNIDPEIVKHISTFELHSGYKKIRWEAYIRALNKGWTVAPIGVFDNHGFDVISNPKTFPPTIVLAHELTREAITKALKERRTFVSWIKGVELRYAVNGYIMGSTLEKADTYNFEIRINTRASNPEDRVKKIQVLRNHPEGKDDVTVAAEITLDGNKDEIVWTPAIKNTDAKFLLLRVFHNSDLKEDGSYKEHGSTVSAPVWIGK